MNRLLLFFFLLIQLTYTNAQNNDLGAWYGYFWNYSPNEKKVGFQGDIQYRNPEILGDRVQFLARASATYQLKNPKLKLALGYTNISSWQYGINYPKIGEHNIYEDFFIKQKTGSQLNILHRVRLEQRFRPNENFRNRVRYQIVFTYPLNNNSITENTWYLALFDEVFFNMEKDIGGVSEVDTFDRNRLYLAVGYAVKPELKFQFGFMAESTRIFSMNLLQFSLIHQIH